MSIEGFGIWIARAIGGQIIKDRFARRGLQAQLKSLQKALIDSQNDRDEMVGFKTLASAALVERDLLQAEIIRLGIENIDLRRRLEAVGGNG